jgi:hypothetical protein
MAKFQAIKNAAPEMGPRSRFLLLFLLYQFAMGDWDMIAGIIFGAE